MSAKDRRKAVHQITQRTGATVVSITTGMRGVVVGHYDDDSVYVQISGEVSPSRWWVSDLALDTPEGEK